MYQARYGNPIERSVGGRAIWCENLTSELLENCQEENNGDLALFYVTKQICAVVINQ